MGRDPRHDILFEPVQIGPKTLRNRFYQVPHCTGFGVEKPWSQARHRAARPRAALGGGQYQYCTIARQSPTRRPYISARLWDDGDVRMLAATCDEGAPARVAGGRRALALRRPRRERRDAAAAAASHR